MTLATKAAAFPLREDIGECGPAGSPIDFTLKIVNPKANQAPALWLVIEGEEIELRLTQGDENSWHAGICAEVGANLDIYAACRVNKDGSMTLSIKEPGFSYLPRKIKPHEGVCSLGPLPYQAG